MKTRKNPAKPLTRSHVSVLLLADEYAMAAHVSFAQTNPGTGEVTEAEATGSAKREPGDTRDDTIAINLAVGRALVKLGGKLQDTGRSQVEAAAARRSQARKEVIARRLSRGVKPDAASRAASRREPHGRHARDGKEG